MRTLCDACESAPAILFCPADEAALCRACDEMVHTCNKLASRHVRVGLANPVDVPRCDICETAHGFFYCEVDGIALCLECDMIVHVEGKRTHARYLLPRQKVEFPEEPDIFEVPAASQIMVQAEIRRPQVPPQLPLTLTLGDNQQNRGVSLVRIEEPNSDGHARTAIPMIDLNRKPRQPPEQTSYNQYH